METKFFVQGMTCGHCEKKIQSELENLISILSVKAYSSKNLVIINHSQPLDVTFIKMRLNALGYPVRENDPNQDVKRFGMSIILLIISYVILRYSNQLTFDFLPNIRQNMGYGALFVVGLLTSIHCIAMCGGINITQCSQYKNAKPSIPSLLYNLGRVTSYTLIGGLVGGIGSVLSFSGQFKGYVTLIVSFIMILMSFKMLKILQIKMPLFKTPPFIKQKIHKYASKGPFFIGLANGFMPCGPLQSMQLYALGTGSFVMGALSMFYFSLGTFPLMFILGYISALLDHRFSKHIMKVSGLLIFILGVAMFSRGAALAGVNLPIELNGDAIQSQMVTKDLQEIRFNLKSNHFEPLQVQVGIPVKLIIYADMENLNGCNNPIAIPSLGIEQTLYPGENIILFTPTEKGKITYTCWMGMITSTINVIE